MNPMRTQKLPESPLSKSVTISVIIHLILIFSSFLLGNLIVKSTPDLPVSIIERSVRVDVVAMPKMTIKELESLPKVPIVKEEESKVAAPSEPKEIVPKVADDSEAPVIEKEVKKKSFLEMLKEQKKKKLEAPKENKRRQREEEGIDSDSAAKLNNLILEGNQVQKGTARTGDGAAVEGDFQLYVSSLPDFLSDYWTLPSWLKERDLRCVIQVWINSRGEVIRTEVLESSGNKEYDQRALASIKAASPFPVPASEIVSKLMSGKVALVFPL